MLIRRESDGDHAAVETVVGAAFGRAESPAVPVEATLVRALRHDAGWIGALSLVAEDDGRIVGHVVCSRARVGELPVLGLGPLAVSPNRHGEGIGQALMHAVIGAAEARGEPLIALLGDPRYYRRFGFVEASTLGVIAPEPQWGEHFQVRRLTDCPPSIGGTFRYAAPFDAL